MIINSNATIYLNGVNIEVLKPVSIDDYSKPNPININGSYIVDLYLVDGSTNRLASEEGTIVSDGWVRNGSGKAALRVPEGAALNIYGNTGILNATGAQGKNHAGFAARGGGGAAIGGNGGIEYSTSHYYEPAEASGLVNVFGGIIEATGGDAMGHHGYGGTGIGSGGLEYNGTPVSDGEVSIYGGYVYLRGGAGKQSGYAVRGDLHLYAGNLIAMSALQGNTICAPFSKEPLTYPTQYAWRVNALDLMEVSYVSSYTFEDIQRYVEIQEDFTGPYDVTLAKNAAQNANYLDTTQAVATSETIIMNALKAVAEFAINNESTTVTVNRISYELPTEGTSASPAGTNGSYTFTITITQGEYIQTTTENTIAIIATAFGGVSDVDAVVATKALIVDGSVDVVFNASQLQKTIAVQTYVNELLGVNPQGVSVLVDYVAENYYSVLISKGSIFETKVFMMVVNEALDPDIARVQAAKALAQGASYLDTTQVIATSETIIKNSLKAMADLAVNDESITVIANKISYVLPIAGTSTLPAGIDGRYTFTITVSRGEQMLNTEEVTIIIKATHTKLHNPEVIIEQDKNVYEFNALGLENGVLFSEEERFHEVFVKLVFSVLTNTNIPTQDKLLIDGFIKDVLNFNKSELFVVDISLFKMVGDTSTPVTNTLDDVTISFALPDAFRDVEFNLVRVHGEEVEVLDYIIDEETFVITFTSNKFSIYSLVAELEDEIAIPDTSDSSKMFNWLLMLVGFALLLFGVRFDKKDMK